MTWPIKKMKTFVQNLSRSKVRVASRLGLWKWQRKTFWVFQPAAKLEIFLLKLHQSEHVLRTIITEIIFYTEAVRRTNCGETQPVPYHPTCWLQLEIQAFITTRVLWPHQRNAEEPKPISCSKGPSLWTGNGAWTLTRLSTGFWFRS